VYVHEDVVFDLVIGGEVISTTEDHPFWSVTDQRFERADQLEPGELVLSPAGAAVQVSGVLSESSRAAVAYNLAVEDIHTFHVGVSQVLVHNTCDLPVNLATAARTDHILQGDATGGGQLWPGLPGKTAFPESWSEARIMHEISDVATDPSSTFSPAGRGSTIVTGLRDGVEIQVVLRGGNIVSGYPINLPRDPK
jgi:hypothetical protein